MFRSVSSDLGKLAYVEIIVAERQIYRMQKLNGEYPKYPLNIAPIFPCFFFLQEPTVTRLPIIVACHLPPRILIMTRAAATVSWIIKASGGTIVVTSPIWMVCTQERIKGTEKASVIHTLFLRVIVHFRRANMTETRPVHGKLDHLFPQR